MIDLAKTLNNDADMIKFAQIFAQQPRNTVRVQLQLRAIVPVARASWLTFVHAVHICSHAAYF